MLRRMALFDLADPTEFSRVYVEHARSVYGAALRILGSPAQAQDVTQDVFLKLWRSPRRFDPQRGELGAYLRLMARSRALDLYREGQAAGRASDRMRLVVSRDEGRVAERPRATRPASTTARRPRPSARSSAPVCGPRWPGCPTSSARRSCSPTGA